MMSWVRRVGRVEWAVLSIWIGLFSMYQMHSLNDPDTPWHIASGLYILQHHHIPTTDPFSWTMLGKPWVTQEWLFEVILAWFAKYLQFAGVWLVISLIHAVTVLILYRVGLRASDGNRFVAAVVACVAPLAGIDFWTVRPQIFSYMMFAVFLWILVQVRDGRFRILLAVPPLMLVWANMHGSSSIGVLMLVLEVLVSFVPTLGRLQRLVLPKGARIRLLAATVFGALAGFVNPNGIKAYTYALLSTNSTMTDNIMEWHSPNFHTDYFKYGVLAFLMVSFLILLSRRRSLPMRELLYFGGAFAATLVYQRFMPYLAITAVPLMASALHDFLRPLLRPSRLLGIVSSVTLVAMAGAVLHQLPSVRGSVDSHMDTGSYPVKAVDYLIAHHDTNGVVNAYHWGGYLIYRGVPTFVDGRTDIFLQGSVFTDYLSMRNMWWNGPYLINSYHAKAVLFPSGDPIITYLNNNPNWRVVYEDNLAEILVPANKTS